MAVVLLYVVIAPYTKVILLNSLPSVPSHFSFPIPLRCGSHSQVEESFNLQAFHDFLFLNPLSQLSEVRFLPFFFLPHHYPLFFLLSLFPS